MEQNDLKTFNKVRGYRAMLGFTADEMASYLGISRQAYANKENGNVSFSKAEMVNFANLLKEFIPDITVLDIFFE